VDSLRGGTVEVYSVVTGFSLVSMMKKLKLKTLLDKVNDRTAQARLARAYPGVKSASLLAPLNEREFVVLKGRVAEGSPQVLQGLVMSQTFMIPILLMLVIIYSSQMIAVSIGQEKENKTLETLLTVPINRVAIVVGKMMGAACVAVVISGVFIVAMAYYMGSFMGDEAAVAGQAGANVMADLNLGLTVQSYVLLGVALFLAVLCALSLATLLAIFADDAKSAQVAITPLMMLVLLPYLFGMFFDVQTASLPIKVLMYVIPFSYPFLTPKAVFFGNYGLVFAGFGYMALFATVCIVAAARIFSSDRILTAKLRFRRKSVVRS
jgi:ABC-2 type transport system permease protein